MDQIFNSTPLCCCSSVLVQSTKQAQLWPSDERATRTEQRREISKGKKKGLTACCREPNAMKASIFRDPKNLSSPGRKRTLSGNTGKHAVLRKWWCNCRCDW